MLHIRNLPYETTEEELRELCSPFGPIVQTKLNVGTNKNQAFVEFPDMNMAIQMVSYFANSADPAKVSHTKFCWLAIPFVADPRDMSTTLIEASLNASVKSIHQPGCHELCSDIQRLIITEHCKACAVHS